MRACFVRARLACAGDHLARLTTVIEHLSGNEFGLEGISVSGDGQDGDGDHPQISVVIAVLNGMPWIDHQLTALSAQDFPGRWEVVVADNGSEDGTRACIREWANRDQRFCLVDASARAGAGAARNIGVEAAQSRLVAFCDADDEVQPGWLSAMWAALAETDLVAGVFDFRSLNGLPASRPIPAATRHMGFLPFALGANLAVRRDAFDAVDGFCETIPPSEDTDLSWRLQLPGSRFGLCDGAVVAKRDHAAGMPTFRAGWHYGRCAPRLFLQYRSSGMKRDLRGAAKAWVWLVLASPGLVMSSVRRDWVRSLAERSGRVAGSITYRTFFP